MKLSELKIDNVKGLGVTPNNMEIDITEMTMKAGDLSGALKKTFEYYSEKITDDELTHIGDIDSVKVMRFELINSKKPHGRDFYQIIDFFVEDNVRIGMMGGDRLRINPKSKLWNDNIKFVFEIKEWIIFNSRNGLGSKYLYFLKNVLNTPLMIGNIHSIATQEFLKKHAELKRFSLFWYNVKTGEIEKFDDSKYSLSEPTAWQVLIESDSIPTFNQYRTEVPSIRNDYSWLFDSIESLK
jgi:hypothetical protein